MAYARYRTDARAAALYPREVGIRRSFAAPIIGKGNSMEDSNNRGPFSRTHINVNEGFELRYWAKQLGVSLEQLKSAVRRVGSETDLVRGELKRQGF
jgi:hypothetical protein